MTIIRQDAWTNDEDNYLAETVLAYIRNGSTQLKAFEEAGAKLNRTAAACGFRWNAYVRKQFRGGIDLAKKERKKIQSADPELTEDGLPIEMIGRSDVSEFFHQLEVVFTDYDRVRNENKHLHEEILELTKNKNETEKSVMGLRKEFSLLQAEYHTLLDILNQARSKAIVNRDEQMT